MTDVRICPIRPIRPIGPIPPMRKGLQARRGSTARRVAAAAILCLLAASSFVARAQESLEVILERGYIAHWLVCGPFEPDAAGGIPAALARGEAALGDTDFMQRAGGIARLRPKHLDLVRPGVDGAMWQRAGTTGPALDLVPFFPETGEGISYAAFYCQVDEAQSVLLDLQTPLGARVWLNGFLLREIQIKPVDQAGADLFVMDFRVGTNLVVMEIPGATYDTLAAVAGMSARELSVYGFANRPLLRGTSGYEIALKLDPARPLGDLYYVPRLENAGTFSGTSFDVRQDAWLTVFNPDDAPSLPLQVALTGGRLPDPLLREMPAIPPESRWRPEFPIPVGNRRAGDAALVRVRLVLGTAVTGLSSAEFNASLKIRARSEGGRVYVVTGSHHDPGQIEDQAARMERKSASYVGQMILRGGDPDYGFNLGPASDWKPCVQGHPALGRALRDAAGAGLCASEAGFAHPDERIAGGELLWRNLRYGLLTGHARLSDSKQAFYAWNMPGVAPQTPQLLAFAGLRGLVSNLDVAGLPGLFHHQALDGTRVYHRRKKTAPGPVSTEELRHMVALQRRELIEQKINVDVLVNQSLVPPPEPFWLGACTGLKRSYPAIRVEGGGGSAFLNDLAAMGADVSGRLPVRSWLTTSTAPGMLATQPGLKRAYAATERRLLSAEQLACWAAMLGASYPDAALDASWRQLLYYSSPSTLGQARRPRAYVDTMAGYRDAAEMADEVVRKALDYIAAQADTLSNAPIQTEGVRALVVYNPAPWARTDVFEGRVSLEGARGLGIVDDQGHNLPYVLEDLQPGQGGGLRSALLRFVAKKIPGMGYRCFYLVPEGPVPRPSLRTDPQIENSFYRLFFDEDTGAIRSLIDKRNGADYAAGLLNHVLALDEDTGKTQGGREFWTTGTWSGPETGVLEQKTEVTAWMQRYTTVFPFAGGTVRRCVTLYEDIPRIDCETHFEGVDLSEKLLALTFDFPDTGRSAVFGERFGTVVARQSRGALDYRTKGLDNLSGSGLQPALDWAGISPNDYIQVGPNGAVPLRPATIIHGANPALAKAASGLREAFIRRGIPAMVMPDRPRRPDFLWSDSTEFLNIRSSLDTSGNMHIVLGSPEHNFFCGELVAKLPEEAAKRFSERLEQGAVMLIENDDVPEGYAPIPTLLFAALLPERSRAMADDFAQAIRVRGTYAVPPSAYFPEDPPQRPESGAAVLFPGAFLASHERDGALVLPLAHGHNWRHVGEDLAPLRNALDAEPQAFEYAIWPHDGDWRQAHLPQVAQGFAAPFLAATTDPHLGPQPGRQSFLSVETPNLMISAVKPAGNRFAIGAGEAPDPREGIVAHWWEAEGIRGDAVLRLASPIRDAARSGFLERREQPVPTDARRCTIPGVTPASLGALWLLPASPPRPGPAEAIGRTADPYRPIYNRYWRHNSGAAPIGYQPLSVILEGRIEAGENRLNLIVANNQTQGVVTGIVHITATDGWSVGPAQFAFDAAPGGYDEQVIRAVRTLTASAALEAAGVVAETTYEGQRYRDVLLAGENTLRMTVTRNAAQIRVHVENRAAVPAEGYLDIITASRFWPELGQRLEATQMPRRAAISIAPFATQDVLFRFSDPGAATWAVAKLAANGELLYRPVPE